jgi:Rod binding domain-containing protein
MIVRSELGSIGQTPAAPHTKVGAADHHGPDVREAAKQFEGIMIRQMLAPLEKSLTAGSGGGSVPMVGGMVMESLSQGILSGGGLGLADMVEQALRGIDSTGKTGPKDGEK